MNNNYLTKIIYAIHSPSSEQNLNLTWANNFDQRLLQRSSALTVISRLQKNIFEIFSDTEHSIRYRISIFFDGYTVRLINSIREINESPYYINVIFTEESIDPEECPLGTIIVFLGEISECRNDHIHHSKISPSIFKKKVLELINKSDKNQISVFNEIKELSSTDNEYTEINLEPVLSENFYSQSSILALKSNRVKAETIKCENIYEKSNTETIINIFNHIKTEVRKNIKIDFPYETTYFYITDLSSNLELSSKNNEFTDSENKLRNRDLEEAIKFSKNGRISDEVSENPYISELENERSLLSNLIGLSAANDVCPVIKIKLNNNEAYNQIKTFRSTDNRNPQKIHRAMAKLRDIFSPHMDCWLEYVDSHPSAPIKLISNLPLEWSFHQGLPLIVRHEVSRIPITPGYISSKLLLDSDKVHLTLEAFKKILIIRSFNDDDPIKDHLKNSIDKIKKNKDFINSLLIRKENFKHAVDNQIDIEFKWIDVSDSESLIDAINNHPCAITVFDMHGGHGTQGSHLYLKDEKISIFDIASKINISPIIILSACDTSPIDKGHHSTADAFILAGAKSLISSALPINSAAAARFLMRLIIRIETLLPGIGETSAVKWSTLVSGMIRRTYYTELLEMLQKELKFPDSKRTEIFYKIAFLIDPLHNNWPEKIQQKIINELNISEIFLKNFISRNVQFLECMKYFQIGRPELISISKNGYI